MPKVIMLDLNFNDENQYLNVEKYIIQTTLSRYYAWIILGNKTFLMSDFEIKFFYT